MKTNKDRYILSAVQISGMDSSFWRRKVCADIRRGSLERGRQTSGVIENVDFEGFWTLRLRHLNQGNIII